jgi:hypothetical protein
VVISIGFCSQKKRLIRPSSKETTKNKEKDVEKEQQMKRRKMKKCLIRPSSKGTGNKNENEKEIEKAQWMKLRIHPRMRT